MRKHKRPQTAGTRKLPSSGALEPQAVRDLRQALALEPGNARLWAFLGGRLFGLGRGEEAEAACRKSLAEDPGCSQGRHNLALVLMEQGRLMEAEGEFRRALALEPAMRDARMGLSECLFRLGDQEKAYLNLSAALCLESKGDPDSPRAANERGLLDLLFGKMPEGWDGHEARLKIPGQVGPTRAFAEPRWEGQPFPGRTLLLHYEQGLGDTIMFLRYAPLVRAMGGRVIAEVQRPLAGLAATCPGLDAVISRGDALPPFDLQIALPSLPWALRTDLASVPDSVPYLDVPLAVPHRQEITQIIAASVGKVRVGVVWAGNPGYKIDAARSIPPALLAPLAALPGVAWHSFQLGGIQSPPLPGLVSLAPFLGDFSDTAYALSGMDLLITVDTAMAHLGGAMAVPTLMLVPFYPDWRWLLGRSDSPWYPTLRIYRQTRPGDWESAIHQMVADLTQEG